MKSKKILSLLLKNKGRVFTRDDLLNRVYTDIYEYEKENLAQEEKEQIVQQLQGLLKEKKRRFSLRRYLGKSFQNAAFMNC